MKTEIELRDPVMLDPLPFVKKMVRWAKDSNEAKGLRDDIRANGIKHPLLITAAGKLVDGETRRQAAMGLQMMEVPCQVVADDEVQEIIVRELVRRRNLTKGQLAYVVTPLIQSAFIESIRRRGEKLSKGQQIPVSDSVGNGIASAAEWAGLMGFSMDLLDQARRLHEIFTKKPTLREEWEPKILDQDKPVGLGAALAGIGGAKEENQIGRDSKIAVHQMELALGPICEHANRWSEFSENQREQVIGGWKKFAAEMPKNLRKTLIEILQDA